MSELQRELDKRFEGYGLEYQSAHLFSGENRITVFFTAAKLIPYPVLSDIKAYLSALIEDCTVESDIDFKNADIEIEHNFKTASEILKQAFFLRFPEHAPLIKLSKWSIINGEIIAEFPNALEAALTLSDIDSLISKIYKIHIPVKPIFTMQTEVELPAVGQSVDIKGAPIAKKPKELPKSVLYGKTIADKTSIPIDTITDEMDGVIVCGRIFRDEMVTTKNQRYTILLLDITDNTNSITVKLLKNFDEIEKLSKDIQDQIDAGSDFLVRGKVETDDFEHELILRPTDIMSVDRPLREDTCEEKRVELHLHTQYSTMDGVTHAVDAINTAARFGHKAIAITDHGVVHAFPEANKAAIKAGIKLIYGCEGYLYPDSILSSQSGRFVVIGFTTVKPYRELLLYEISAFRIDNFKITDNFYAKVNPGTTPTGEISKIFNGENDFKEAGGLRETLSALSEYIKGDPIIVHDAIIYEEIKEKAEKFGFSLPMEHVDVKLMTTYLHRELKDFSIDALKVALDIEVGESLGAKRSSEITFGIYKSIADSLKKLGETDIPLMILSPNAKEKGRGHHSFHIILIAKNHEGLINLYKLVSFSHIEHFKSRPRIPRSLLLVHKAGLIIGSACEQGEVFRSIVEKKSEEEQRQIAKLYDYLEIQPIANNKFMLKNGTVNSEDELRDLNRRVIDLAESIGKPTVATCDAHFLNPEDAVYRKLLLHALNFSDIEESTPLYFRTTDEMLNEFSYLGEEKARSVVIDAPNAIADSCEIMKPYLDDKPTYSPIFDHANEDIEEMARKKAHDIYGEKLPKIVGDRLDRELKAIIGNDYSSLYLMAQRLVQKSMSDGYLVGSRGSVGSSFVAFCAGITEVNPLPAHYICKNCQNSEFFGNEHPCGLDMEDRNCPVCGEKYEKTGYDIPFEVFLGFKGDKTPDIDLNFSGEYQPIAHKFTEEMMGEGHSFRSGTISTLKERTVYGYVKSYADENGLVLRKAEINRLVSGCVGVKKTTGQHPGGMIVVPADHSIMEFTPLQYPADKKEGNSCITHFDFHSLDDKLVKLDILGHDNPTALKMLRDLTGLDPTLIPLDDSETRLLYSSDSPLKVSLSELGCDIGTLGIPEFGTNFVRNMLGETRPKLFEELIRIAGLSHGENVWTDNAEPLVVNGTATLSEVFCTRDDIMNYLIARGCEPSMSFKIMERVRKGKGLTDEMEQFVLENKIPSWAIDSLKKIKYMFPRAHAVAYLIMSFRIAYYKVHYPEAFYAVYFTVRADDFDISLASGGTTKVLKNIFSIKNRPKDEAASDSNKAKQNDQCIILEMVYEMNLRGIELLPVDIEKSEAHNFTIEGSAVRPPFSSIPGLGGSAADSIVQARKKGGDFTSIEDFKSRCKVNASVLTLMTTLGCFKDIRESEQMSLFDMM
ncbi:MAG: PolC-type DNA polymerase III, partial [Clostridia bacterium]